MAVIIKHARTTNPATAYPVLADGEIAFNLAKMQMAVGSAGAKVELIAVRFFQATSTYAVGDFAVNAGTLLRCSTAITVPHAFNSAEWGGAAGGLSDAPSDGTPYARKDAAWVVVTSALVGATPINLVDNKNYIRRNASWIEAVASSIRRGTSSNVDTDLTAAEGAITSLQTTKITDAPSDGLTYGRRNAAWVTGAGNVSGPASAADLDFAIFDGITGKLIKTLTSPGSTRILNQSTIVGGTLTDVLNAIKATDDGQATTIGGIQATIATYGTVVTRNTGLASGNVPILDANGKLDTATMPSIAITDVFVVNSQAAMLALVAQTGDMAIRTDLNKTFALATNSPGTLLDWKEMLTPTDAVLSVAGLTGAISATALRTSLGLVIGTNVQAWSAKLDALSALAAGADNLAYFTGATTMAQTPFTAFGRSLVDDPDATAARATLLAEKLGEVAGIGTKTANYLLVATDPGSVIEMNVAAANTFTIQPNATVAIAVNSRVDVVQYGAGQTTFVPGAGVTIRSAGGKLKLTGQYSAASLYKRGTDEWMLFGDLSL